MIKYRYVKRHFEYKSQKITAYVRINLVNYFDSFDKKQEYRLMHLCDYAFNTETEKVVKHYISLNQIFDMLLE